MLSKRDLYVSTLDESTRFVDLRVDLVSEVDGERIISVGGQWDRARKRYGAEAKTARKMALHVGQIEAARWFAEWFKSKIDKKLIQAPIIEQLSDGTQVEKQDTIWSVLMHGGRRAGKTDLLVKMSIAYAIFQPRSFIWLISESLPKTEELLKVVQKALPRGWYSYLGAPRFQFTLANGSLIWLRSAHKPENLKRGRCDFAGFNEAQGMSEDAFLNVRAATADNGGLTILAANPPKSAIGMWVENFYDESKARRRAAKTFFFDARKNPHVVHESLDSLRRESDDKTFRREILGEFVSIGDAVFHAWNPRLNIRPLPPQEHECTARFLKQHFGGFNFKFAVGCDFQIVPHMAAVVIRAYMDPSDPEVWLWYSDEVMVENGDEHMLIDGLEAKGYRGEDCVVIADGSGQWQDADRTKGRGSFDMFRARGWKHIYAPDPKSMKNPEVIERIKVANARMRAADGKRRLFSSPDNIMLNRALKAWENRNGMPSRRSDYAHFCDAATYPLWRFYPRKVAAPKIEITRIQQTTRRSQFSGW